MSEQWDVAGLHAECLRLVALDLPLAEWAKEDGIGPGTIEERIVAAADRRMAERTANFGTDLMRMAEKSLLLQILDQTWKDHLLSLDHLRQGINLRAYAQRDPLNEYKREAFELFEEMLVALRQQVTSVLSHVELRLEPPAEPPPVLNVSFGGPGPVGQGGAEAIMEREPELAEAEAHPAARPNGSDRAHAQRRGNGTGTRGRNDERPGERSAASRAPWAGTPRNAACPCGSGKKFKHCHGRV